MSSEQIEWAGIDQSGNPLPNGTYSFELESLQDGKVLATTPMELYSEIIEVRGEGGVTVLITEAGSKVDVTDISAVRRAD